MGKALTTQNDLPPSERKNVKNIVRLCSCSVFQELFEKVDYKLVTFFLDEGRVENSRPGAVLPLVPMGK
jgi:hypothetical protein